MKNTKTRKIRIRSKIKRISKRFRLVVHRTNSHIYAQLINDQGKVLASASDKDLKTKSKMTKTEEASVVGELIAKKAKELKVIDIAFDRSGYKYHGRIKSLADSARKGGLNF